MSDLTETSRRRAFRAMTKSRVRAALTAIALSMTMTNAHAGDPLEKAGKPRSGDGVPAWVVRDCRPATGVEILSRFAGPGYWFYRETGDFCYFDRRPGVM
jgi:hypothetical protein